MLSYEFFYTFQVTEGEHFSAKCVLQSYKAKQEFSKINYTFAWGVNRHTYKGIQMTPIRNHLFLMNSLYCKSLNL